MNIVLLGPPGAGKGTLASLIKEKFGFQHVSTGDMLREEMKAGSSLGKEAKSYVESGKLVPDDLVIKLIEARLTGGKDKKGYLLDGFPRTTAQAEALDKILERIRQPIDFAVYMEASLPVIVLRLTGRRVCKACGAVYHIKNRPSKKGDICDQCGGELYQRTDDKEETIRTRMDVYLKSTSPIIEYYQAQGRLRKVDADKNVEETIKDFNVIAHENRSSHTDKVSGRN